VITNDIQNDERLKSTAGKPNLYTYRAILVVIHGCHFQRKQHGASTRSGARTPLSLVGAMAATMTHLTIYCWKIIIRFASYRLEGRI
jgi:hypothetical protein